MDLTQIRNFPLKVIFLIHVLFMSMSTAGYWTPTSYIFYNSVVLGLIYWGIISDLEDPLQLGLILNGFSIILDLFTIAFNFPSHDGLSRFGAVIAVLFMVVKIFTCFYLVRIVRQRIGVSGPISGIGDIFPPSRDVNYEDIDRTAAPSRPNEGGYDFSTAQQI